MTKSTKPEWIDGKTGRAIPDADMAKRQTRNATATTKRNAETPDAGEARRAKRRKPRA